MKKTEELLEILRKELKDGRYPPGSKFPSEQKLMTRFKAARTTINKITEQLVSEGFIERGVQGSGTRVRDIAPFPGGELAYLGTIGSPYYARILHGIQLAAFQKNYAVSFFSPPRLLINFCLDKIARSKYQALGMKDTMPQVPSPDSVRMQAACGLFLSRNLNAVCG